MLLLAGGQTLTLSSPSRRPRVVGVFARVVCQVLEQCQLLSGVYVRACERTRARLLALARCGHVTCVTLTTLSPRFIPFRLAEDPVDTSFIG